MLTPAIVREDRRRWYLRQVPKPLPTVRKRELSPPGTNARRSKRLKGFSAETSLVLQWPQADPALLTRLPVELRMLIWEFAIGFQRLHIVRKIGNFGRIGHVVCIGDDPVCIGCIVPWKGGKIRRVFVVADEPYPVDEELAEWSPLSLLKACRQIYTEAIDLLYMTNEFIMNHAWNLTFLQTTILPKRFASIRCLSLTHHFAPSQFDGIGRYYGPSWEYPEPEATWESACKALLTMEGLRELTITVGINIAGLVGDVRRGLVGAFKSLQQLPMKKEDFLIYMPTDYTLDLSFMRKGLEDSEVHCTVALQCSQCKAPRDTCLFPECPDQYAREVDRRKRIYSSK